MWQTDRQTDRRTEDFFIDKPHNIRMQVKFAMSANWARDELQPTLMILSSPTSTLIYQQQQQHTHPFNGPMSRWAGTRKVKPIWILLKQETVSGSGVSWAICKSAPCSRQITTPAPHHSVCLQAGCPSCRPTNSVKALKALYTEGSNLSTTSATNTHKSQPGQSRLC